MSKDTPHVPKLRRVPETRRNASPALQVITGLSIGHVDPSHPSREPTEHENALPRNKHVVKYPAGETAGRLALLDAVEQSCQKAPREGARLMPPARHLRSSELYSVPQQNAQRSKLSLNTTST